MIGILKLGVISWAFRTGWPRTGAEPSSAPGRSAVKNRFLLASLGVGAIGVVYLLQLVLETGIL